MRRGSDSLRFAFRLVDVAGSGLSGWFHVVVAATASPDDIGQIVAEELRRDGILLVIVENDPAREPELIRNNELYVLGSALNEGVLDQAGIGKAADIVVATASDPDNVYISLSARSRNPRIRIHARAESEIGLKHLRLAGVERALRAQQRDRSS